MYPVFVGKTAFPLKGSNKPEQSTYVANANQPSFRLLDGPPYANGALHLGHVLNKSLKDVMVRAAKAAGHSVLWQPGWDCHGLPVEVKVEQLGHDRTDKAKFAKHARAYALGQQQEQAKQFKDLGVCADFEQPYLTMDYAQEAATMEVLAKMVEKGLVYHSHEATWWCPACQSTLAAFEHEEMQKEVSSCYVGFKVAEKEDEYFLAWTTTPWTLAYNEALVVNDKAQYGKYMLRSVVAWLSVASAEDVHAAYGAEMQLPLELRLGNELHGLTYLKPFGGVGKVLADDMANAEGGTGVLHAVPAFGHDDFKLGKKHGLAVTKDLLENGTFSANSPFDTHKGVTVKVASGNAMAVLRAEGSALYLEKPWKQAQPHCWRHKMPLVVRPSSQWYLKVEGAVRDRALMMLDKVKFVPESGRNRLTDAVAKRPDWCLSRQRAWGVPMALFVHKETKELHPRCAELLRAVAKRVSKDGVEGWWDSTAEDWLEGDDVDSYDMVRDVLDVWFDSGACWLTTKCNGDTPDVALEGHDQHRGWFQSSLLVAAACAVNEGETLPYKMVVTHGFVVNTDGKKLSKSEGGDKQKKTKVPAWNTLPADVVRVWATQSACHLDKEWGEKEVAGAMELYGKMRNSVRFLAANLAMFKPQEYHTDTWWLSDKWVVVETNKVCSAALAYFGNAQFEKGTQVLHTLCNEALSKTYFAMVKDRLYCGAEHGAERVAALEAMHAVASVLLPTLEVLLPNMVSEVAAFMQLSNVRAPVFDAEDLSQCQALLAWRNQVAFDWAPFSAERGGGTSCGKVEMRVENNSAWRAFPENQMLEWLGVSGLYLVVDNTGPSPTLAVSRMVGVVCPRCRWVATALATDVCHRCESRTS